MKKQRRNNTQHEQLTHFKFYRCKENDKNKWASTSRPMYYHKTSCANPRGGSKNFSRGSGAEPPASEGLGLTILKIKNGRRSSQKLTIFEDLSAK